MFEKEKQNRDVIMSIVMDLMNNINVFFDRHNIKGLPNIGMELYNKLTIMSLMFYKKKELFFISVISNFITQYLINIVKYGVMLLNDYEIDMLELFINNPDKFCMTNDIELIRKKDDMYNKYYKYVNKIRNFNIETDIIKAVESSCNALLDGMELDEKEYVIRMCNIDLHRLGFNTKIPSYKELNIIDENDDIKGKGKGL